MLLAACSLASICVLAVKLSSNKLSPIFDPADNRIKVLFVPFAVAGYQEHQPVYDIFGRVMDIIKEDSLGRYIILKRGNPALVDVGKIDEQDVDKKYFNNLLEETGADIILYGKYEAPDRVVCCWFSTDTISKELSGIARAPYPGKIAHRITRDEVNRVAGCPLLVASYLSLKIEFLSYQYRLVLKRFPAIAENKNCFDCRISQLAHYTAVESALQLWEYATCRDLLARTDSLSRQCPQTFSDTFRRYALESQLYFGNDENVRGLQTARALVAYIGQRRVDDVEAFLSLKLLISEGLYKTGLIAQAIKNAQEVIGPARPYPTIAAANYCNLSSYYTKLYSPDGATYNKALGYLKKAEALAKPTDTALRNEIYQNYIAVYTYRMYVNQEDPRQMQMDSMQFQAYVRKQNSLNRELRVDAADTSNYALGMLDRIADVYLTKYKSTSDTDTIRFYGEKAKAIYHHILEKLAVREPNSRLVLAAYDGLSSYYGNIGGRLDSALLYLKQEVAVFDRHPDVALHGEIAGARAMLVQYYIVAKQKDSAIKYYNSGLAYLKGLSREVRSQSIDLHAVMPYFTDSLRARIHRIPMK